MNFQTYLFKNFLTFKFLPIRTCKQLPKGIKYFGFTFYPRSENFKDPPYEPSKLFLVKRIKSMKGTNPKEKKCLAAMNIDGDKREFGHLNVVKNIPSTNAVLWKIKHLIEIRPITYKNELPKDGDYLGTYLRETGEFIISPKLKPCSEQIEVSEKGTKSLNKLQRSYLKTYLKNKWLFGLSESA